MYVSKDLALILKDRGFSKSFSSNSYYTTILSEEVVDWIFNCDEPTWIIGSDVPDGTSMLQCKLWWLQFWYTTLLEHKFSLMHEFIGRLEEWFESNNIEFVDYKGVNGGSYYISTDTNKPPIIYKHRFKTKRQAKHEAIMKCFELLKTDKHEE